jgi:hypothetical protein
MTEIETQVTLSCQSQKRAHVESEGENNYEDGEAESF